MRWSLSFPDKFVLFFKIFKEKKYAGLIILFAVGLLLIGIASVPRSEEADAAEMTLEEYKQRLEEELEDACSSVNGVGKCRVIVTFERGAENTYKSGNLVESKPPRVLGVSVICRGADSDEVRRAITQMMTSLFDIGANRVSVMLME